MEDLQLRSDIAHLFQDRLSRRWCLKMAIRNGNTLVRNCGTIVAVYRDKITCPPCRNSGQKKSRASVAFTLLVKKYFRLRDPIVDRRGACLQRFDWMG